MLGMKSLKELFGRGKETWNENDISFLVYKNRFDEVKPYQVAVVFTDDDELDVYDIEENKIKTFKVANILSKCASYDEAIEVASNEQTKYEIIPRNKTGRTFANREKLLEVCFTGFSKAEKEELVQLAKENDMFVRTGVAKTLSLLICGETSGWAKLEKAKELRVAKVYGAEGFRNFIETGEIAE